jgi:hypothetical protein
MEEAQVSITYTYEVSGVAAGGQTWTTTGTILSAKAGNFALVPDEVMRLSFEQLTNGKAVYGLPGVGCKGPYAFTRMLIERSS